MSIEETNNNGVAMRVFEMYELLTVEEKAEIKRDIFRMLRSRGCIEGYIDRGGGCYHRQVAGIERIIWNPFALHFSV